MEQKLIFDPGLIRRYDVSGPRYTSYPTAVQFGPKFDEKHFREYAHKSSKQKPKGPLSLYFHIPFCNTVCFYCACNKVVTKDRGRAQPYLDRMYKEIAMQSQLFGSDRLVEQLHWGGGTPTFISHDQMRELMANTRQQFNLCDDDSGEYSIEIDPRETQDDTISLLRELGFNRLSMGVQDFDARVQQAVNRIQSEQQTRDVFTQAKREGFKSISFDLIYGLPFQSVDSFRVTLEKVLDMRPDRLSVFNYAHLPEMFKPQRRINEDQLPSADEKLSIMQYIIETLTDAGYLYIGMDHFAKPDDELVIAQRNGTLYRNFQGYSTHAECDLIAMGITAISSVANSYSQNVRTVDEYYECIDAGKLPVFRGKELSVDDIMRRDVITQLICHFDLDIIAFQQRHRIDFAQYFGTELTRLKPMQEDGLIDISSQYINVRPAGRLLIRNICMVFDAYLDPHANKQFSRVI